MKWATLLQITVAASIAVAVSMGTAGCGSGHEDHSDAWDHHDDNHQNYHPDIQQDNRPQNAPGYH
jgi:hypothetical protein